MALRFFPIRQNAYPENHHQNILRLLTEVRSVMDWETQMAMHLD
jgi:hypothetical protein